MTSPTIKGSNVIAGFKRIRDRSGGNAMNSGMFANNVVLSQQAANMRQSNNKTTNFNHNFENHAAFNKNQAKTENSPLSKNQKTRNKTMINSEDKVKSASTMQHHQKAMPMGTFIDKVQKENTQKIGGLQDVTGGR